jgi:hypothetical protein
VVLVSISLSCANNNVDTNREGNVIKNENGDGAGNGKGDRIPPTITNILVTDITKTDAIISWRTEEPATSQVVYSTTPFYSSVVQPTIAPLDKNLVISHRVLISGLISGATYYYMVISKDAAGNEEISKDLTFDTITINEEEIVGTWEWVRSVGGIAGIEETPQSTGQSRSVVFDEYGNSTFYRNSTVGNSSSYTLGMALTIFSVDLVPVVYLNAQLTFAYSIEGNTLILNDNHVDGFRSEYSRLS